MNGTYCKLTIMIYWVVILYICFLFFLAQLCDQALYPGFCVLNKKWKVVQVRKVFNVFINFVCHNCDVSSIALFPRESLLGSLWRPGRHGQPHEGHHSLPLPAAARGRASVACNGTGRVVGVVPDGGRGGGAAAVAPRGALQKPQMLDQYVDCVDRCVEIFPDSCKVCGIAPWVLRAPNPVNSTTRLA